MGYFVEGLAEVQLDNISLALDVKNGSPLMNGWNQLRFTRQSRPKAMLVFAKDVICGQVLVNVAKYYVLHNLATYAGQRNGPVILWILLATLLIYWCNQGL